MLSKAPPRGDLGNRLDAALVSSGARMTPGVQAAVVHDGEVVWRRSDGVADLELGLPVTDETVFSLASLSKTLVAALALHLVERGRLALAAPISGLLRNEVPGADVVTAQMLLAHTSGYPDLYETPEVAAVMPPDDDEPGSGSSYDPDRPFTWEMLAPGIREPVEPGARWEYSNAGYIVLTEMLVRILGGADGLRSAWGEIAAAVGPRLTDDALTMERSTVTRMSRGYHLRPDGSFVDPYAAHRPSAVPTDLFGLPFGDGLFAGTAIGVALFLDALFVRRTLLEPASVDLMTTVTPQASAFDHPDLCSYGMGTYRFEAGGAAWQGHRGRYGGFATYGGSEPGSQNSLVVLTNCMSEEPPVLRIWRGLAEELLREGGAAGSARTR